MTVTETCIEQVKPHSTWLSGHVRVFGFVFFYFSTILIAISNKCSQKWQSYLREGFVKILYCLGSIINYMEGRRKKKENQVTEKFQTETL